MNNAHTRTHFGSMYMKTRNKLRKFVLRCVPQMYIDSITLTFNSLVFMEARVYKDIKQGPVSAIVDYKTFISKANCMPIVIQVL